MSQQANHSESQRHTDKDTEQHIQNELRDYLDGLEQHAHIDTELDAMLR